MLEFILYGSRLVGGVYACEVRIHKVGKRGFWLFTFCQPSISRLLSSRGEGSMVWLSLAES